MSLFVPFRSCSNHAAAPTPPRPGLPHGAPGGAARPLPAPSVPGGARRTQESEWTAGW